MAIENALQKMREYYNKGITRSYAFRLAQLKALRAAVIAHEQELYEALNIDLRKTAEECWFTENGFFIAELNNAISKLSDWMKPRPAATNLLNFPSRSTVLSEPLGVVLIISPWNYPFNLLFTPLIGAMAAGNCVVMKSSEFAPATSAVMHRIIETTFDKEYILFTEGDGAVIVPDMMNSFVFDHIFYTGSTAVGRLIYQAAARDLVPVTLELGGKSPCIIETDANLAVAAKRVALGKFSNAGQMCVAPDYLLIHESVKERFIILLKQAIVGFYGTDVKNNPEYSKIINKGHFNRLKRLLIEKDIIHGGEADEAALFIAPTIMEISSADHPAMTEEIFGPILPCIPFSTREDALSIINRNPDPLAFYIFTESRKAEQFWMENVSFGGGCMNNTGFHLTNHHLPFGGRGTSGIGKYHGKFSFDCFSHQKAIMRTPTWFDPSVKYPPYKGKLKLLKLLIR